MKTAIMKVKDIKPAAYNPRVTLKPGDEEWEALSRSLDRFGLVEPLIVNETTGLLVSGHQRLNVLKTQGVEEVEVVIIEADAEQEKLLNIALNKIDGEFDYDKLQIVFDGMDDDDIQFTGFTEEELDNLFGSDSGSDADDSGPDEPAPEDDKEDESEDSDTGEQAPQPFSVFISFPSKEVAEKWLKERDIDTEYEGTNRNITIRMEGIDYGTGD